MVTYVTWKDTTEAFFSARTALRLVGSLARRGYKVKLDYKTISGSRWITME